MTAKITGWIQGTTGPLPGNWLGEVSFVHIHEDRSWHTGVVEGDPRIKVSGQMPEITSVTCEECGEVVTEEEV